MKRKHKKNFNKTCEICGSKFLGVHNQKFCGEKCLNNAWNRRPNALSPGTTGAIAELRVCCDLLSRGYEVFRSLSPSASCDILILKNGILQAVEIRTANRIYNGKLYVDRRGTYDVFAAVLPNEIIYEGLQ